MCILTQNLCLSAVVLSVYLSSSTIYSKNPDLSHTPVKQIMKNLHLLPMVSFLIKQHWKGYVDYGIS